MAVTDDRVVTNGRVRSAPCPECRLRKRRERRIQYLTNEAMELHGFTGHPERFNIRPAIEKAVTRAIELTARDSR
jgi:hypothetical protein